MTQPSAPATRLILPPCEFSDDEELLIWFETVRKIGIKSSDILSEGASYTYVKLRRYAMRCGLSKGAAGRTARSVALPIARGAENMENLARNMRVAAQRFEAFVDAVMPDQAGDFEIKRK